MLSTSQEGRGYPAGTMGARFTARGIPAGDDGAPIGLPEAVEVVRPDVVLGVVAHGVKVVRVVGDGVALLCALMSFGAWLPMGVKLLRSGRGCAHLPGLKRSGRVVCFESYTLLIYTYNTKTNYFDIKTKFSLFLFGSIKIYMYLCSRNNNKTN